MTRYTQKKFIAGLLLISCLISAWLLFVTHDTGSKRLGDFALADSLIKTTLADFNIPKQHISTYNTQVDSNFLRKEYVVSVPPSFSKTQFHATLKDVFLHYGIDLPSRVIFPEKDMSIHLYYRNTVIRTIKLRTDEDLQMHHHVASLVAAFEGRPPANLMDTLTSFGDPIPVVIILHEPLDPPEWLGDFIRAHSGTIIWPQTSSGANLLAEGQPHLKAILSPLQQAFPEATLLSFFKKQTALQHTFKQTSFSFVDAKDALILDPDGGQTAFNQTFRTLVHQAQSSESMPLGILIGSEQALTWTRQRLRTFKLGGLLLVNPRKINF